MLPGALRTLVRPPVVFDSFQRGFFKGACLWRNPLSKTQPPDRWNEKRAMFGLYDNIGILGDFKTHPKQLIRGPSWLKGWKGNELQRCVRKLKWVGNRMFVEDKHQLEKRIKYLFKIVNYRSKQR
uniref:Large ribosomal subunit protein mL51 n=1 Tax=Eptatretus burgeri TaxID=7764 RepID=A0A8C4QRA1_EPTBU